MIVETAALGSLLLEAELEHLAENFLLLGPHPLLPLRLLLLAQPDNTAVRMYLQNIGYNSD